MKYQLFIRNFSIVTSIWILLSFLFGKFQAASDGYNEIGFPFTFYRVIGGKCIECKEAGFLWSPFIYDILIVFFVSFFVLFVINHSSGK